jgi:hypothetical protein
MLEDFAGALVSTLKGIKNAIYLSDKDIEKATGLTTEDVDSLFGFGKRSYNKKNVILISGFLFDSLMDLIKEATK